MIATLCSLSVPLTVLLITGVVTLGLGWWLSVKAEGHDNWLWGDEDE